MLSTNARSFNPHSHPVKWEYYYPRFADGETGAQSREYHTAGITHHAVGSRVCALLPLWPDCPLAGLSLVGGWV